MNGNVTNNKDFKQSVASDANFDDSSTINAAQLVLAEKRTSLSLMRTGISVFALPMAVVSVLIATSKYYETGEVLHLFIPVMILNAALVGLGCYLVIKSIKRIRHQDRVLLEIKRTHPALAPFLD
jgi:uncharacterized membrane protein YidH (DUF202 family)